MLALFALALLLLLPASAGASLANRPGVTLGRLSDDSDSVIVGVVTSSRGGVELRTQTILKGSVGARVSITASPYVSWRVGQRVLVFLRHESRLRFRPIVSEYQRVLISSPTHEGELVLAVRSRLPAVGGPPSQFVAPLFAQLSSASARIREDAAWDLLALRSARPLPSHMDQLAAALRAQPSLPLLSLCARWPRADLADPLLRIALGADPDMRRAAAVALQGVGLAPVVKQLRHDLGGSGPVARAAVLAAAAFDDEELIGLVAEATNHVEERVRLEAVKGLARKSLRTNDIDSLKLIVWRPDSHEVQFRAMAVLALAGEGGALREIAERHPDLEVQRVAARLRRQPARGAREFLK